MGQEGPLIPRLIHLVFPAVDNGRAVEVDLDSVAGADDETLGVAVEAEATSLANGEVIVNGNMFTRN